MLEDFSGVTEIGTESADEGDPRKRKGGKRSGGFYKVGMKLFEL